MTISMMNQCRSSEWGRCWYSLEKWFWEKKNFDFFASGFGYWSPFTSADVKALSEWGHLPLRRIPQWILAPSSLAESLFVSTTPDPASIREALVAKLIHKQKQTKTNKQKKLKPLPLGSLGTRHITEWPGHNMNRMCTSQWHHIKQYHLLLELSTNPCVNSFVKFDLCFERVSTKLAPSCSLPHHSPLELSSLRGRHQTF